MDDDDIDADRLHQHDILGEIARRFRVAHRMAAIFHHKGLARIALHIGQRLDEGFSLGEQRRDGIMRTGHARAHRGKAGEEQEATRARPPYTPTGIIRRRRSYRSQAPNAMQHRITIRLVS